jgi:plastocyanin
VPPRRNGSRALAGGLAAGCLLLAACQHGQPPQTSTPQRGDVTVTPGPDGVQSVQVDANPQYRFVPATIRVATGRVRITLRVAGATPHNLTFTSLVDAGRRVAVPTLSGGVQQSIDFRVSTPGQYRFVCTIHENLGQTGTLIVTR